MARFGRWLTADVIVPRFVAIIAIVAMVRALIDTLVIALRLVF